MPIAQSDIPIQPGETAVTAALRVVTRLAGGIVTSTTTGGHTAGSYHYVGRAVDIALSSGPSWNSPALGRVALELVRIVPRRFISEFIWAGPNPIYIKNGKNVAPYAASAHHNHIHLAATADFIYNAPEAHMAVQVNAPCVGIAASYDANGNIKGYLLVGADYGVFSFGEGAPMLGRVEYTLPAGNDWTPAA